MLYPRNAVKALDALNGHDPEKAHAEADEILLAVVPPSVKAAYKRLQERAGKWNCA